MRYRTYAPSMPVGDVVDTLWLLTDAPPHRMERILPSGTIELVINLFENEIRIYDPVRIESFRKCSGTIVSGAYNRCFAIDTREHAAIMGVHFKPGGAYPVLGLPVMELADAHLDLAALWGGRAHELRERLCAVPTPLQKFQLLEKALLARLMRAPRRHVAPGAALTAFRRTGYAAPVREIVRGLGLSQRRFIEVFATEVGMTPKLYCRVRRFQRALSLASESSAPDWAGVAAECGYFDQSHLIHDFQAFSGLSPVEYVRQRSPRVKENHLPIVG
jgi:AraC-like DNA-binding protein